MKPKTLLALFAVLMLCLPMLAACGGAAQATPTSQPAAATNTPEAAAGATNTPEAAAPTNTTGAATQPTTAAGGGNKLTINLSTWAGADESKELQGVIDKINAAATDFQIVHQASPADYYTKLQTQIAGNTAPDLMWLSQEYVANYADNGAILDVTDMVGKLSDMPAAKLDDYYPGSIAVARYSD